MASTSINRTYWRSFLAVMRFGTLSDAANEQSVSQSTIGRHIDELERVIGQKLFTRSHSRLAPTHLARSLLAPAQAMADAAFALERASAHVPSEGARTVRLTASEMVGIEVLPSVLAELRAENPRLAIELVLSDAQEDLLHRSSDIAVRMTRPKQGRLLQAKVGIAIVALFAHKSYLAAQGTPSAPGDLASHTLSALTEKLCGLGV